MPPLQAEQCGRGRPSVLLAAPRSKGVCQDCPTAPSRRAMNVAALALC